MLSRMYYSVIYWRIGRFLKWFCYKTKMQCCGKRKINYAVEWCSLYAFHDNACKSFSGEVFTDTVKEQELAAK